MYEKTGEVSSILTLPIKKKWFDMIACGEKKEEYRDIKPYYQSRFRNAFCNKNEPVEIVFRNGYSRDSRTITAYCNLRIGQGKPEWGAEAEKDLYILEIVSVKEIF